MSEQETGGLGVPKPLRGPHRSEVTLPAEVCGQQSRRREDIRTGLCVEWIWAAGALVWPETIDPAVVIPPLRWRRWGSGGRPRVGLCCKCQREDNGHRSWGREQRSDGSWSESRLVGGGREEPDTRGGGGEPRAGVGRDAAQDAEQVWSGRGTWCSVRPQVSQVTVEGASES